MRKYKKRAIASGCRMVAICTMAAAEANTASKITARRAAPASGSEQGAEAGASHKDNRPPAVAWPPKRP